MGTHIGRAPLAGQGDYWCVKTPDVSGNNVTIVHVQTFACARTNVTLKHECARVPNMESAGT